MIHQYLSHTVLIQVLHHYPRKETAEVSPHSCDLSLWGSAYEVMRLCVGGRIDPHLLYSYIQHNGGTRTYVSIARASFWETVQIQNIHAARSIYTDWLFVFIWPSVASVSELIIGCTSVGYRSRRQKVMTRVCHRPFFTQKMMRPIVAVLFTAVRIATEWPDICKKTIPHFFLHIISLTHE